MDTVTTVKIEIENMSEEMKNFFLELVDTVMEGYHLNFTKNVKVETVEQILSEVEGEGEDFDERQR